MKKHITISTLFATLIAAVAMPVSEFKSWDDLIERSHDIILARRIATSQLISGRPISINGHPMAICVSDGVMPYPIEVISVLKGGTKPGPAELWSQYSMRLGVLPHLGDLFLAFAHNHNEDGSTNLSYSAYENYQLVVFAFDYDAPGWTNALAGKPLREQVKTILRYRLAPLNEELARDQAEKRRIEDGLKEMEK